MFWVLALFGLSMFAASSFFGGQLNKGWTTNECPHVLVGNTPSSWGAYHSICVRTAHKANTPYSVCEKRVDQGLIFNSSEYTIPVGAYETVRFLARDKAVELEGYYAPSSRACAPTVILVHGRGACKENYEVMMPAAILYNAGYSVLAIDQRNHGGSGTFLQPDGNAYNTWGATEQYDILGAWDYLVSNKSVATGKIGVAAYSMGAAATTVAFGEEPRLRAAWVDSVACSPEEVLALATGNAFGGLLSGAKGLIASWGYSIGVGWISSIDIRSKQPHDGASKLRVNQSYYSVWTTGDQDVPMSALERCRDNAAQSGADADSWLADDRTDFDTRNPTGAQLSNTHVEAMLYYPTLYEQRIVAYFNRTIGNANC